MNKDTNSLQFLLDLKKELIEDKVLVQFLLDLKKESTMVLIQSN